MYRTNSLFSQPFTTDVFRRFYKLLWDFIPTCLAIFRKFFMYSHTKLFLSCFQKFLSFWDKYNKPEPPRLFSNWHTLTVFTNGLCLRWAIKHPDTNFKHILYNSFVHLRSTFQLCDPVLRLQKRPFRINMDATTTKVSSLILRLTESNYTEWNWNICVVLRK